MRRVFGLVRKPTVWLLPLFVLVWVRYFRAELVPTPQSVAPTGAEFATWQAGVRPASRWATIRAVADDGDQVTLGLHEGTIQYVETRLEVRDSRTGADRTPALWADQLRIKLLDGDSWRHSPLTDLLAHPAGRKFLHDEAAWASLRQRLAIGRAKALDDLRKTIRPVADSEAADLFPECSSFSPDGHWFSYVARNGCPLYVVSASLGDGTVIEDVRTGERRAYLLGVRGPVHVAPGGRTAVSASSIWDLDTATRRAELRLPESTFSRVGYSPDGRYVFAHFWPWLGDTQELRWWDAATGVQVGEVPDALESALLDGGRMLVTKPSRTKGNAAAESYVLRFWDVATGEDRGQWDLGCPSDGGGMIEHLVGSGSDRYLAGVYDPDYGRGRPPARRAADRLSRALSGGRTPEPMQVILWDVIERREVTRLTGRSAGFSADGRWLATIDRDGVVGVWAVPVQRPWLRILGYTAGAALGCWAALAGLAVVVRRWWPHPVRDAARGLGWVWGDRRRRRWAAGALGGTALVVGAWVWYAAATNRARAEMEAAYEQIADRMTEAEVTALVGRPPVAGPVTVMTGPKKGGGRVGMPTTLRKWKRYGTELDVEFDEQGTAAAWYISNPPGLGETVARRLGI